MGIVGNLKTMELSELLQWAAQSRKSGTLVISAPEVEKRLYFESGVITSVSSSDPNEWLGHFLVSHGYIDETTLAKAISMQEKDRSLLGRILRDLSAIDAESLGKMLRLKSQESIFELFTWEEGEFRFLDGELPEFKMVPLALQVTPLIFEGIKRLDEWNLVRKAMPSTRAVPVAIGEITKPRDDPAASYILESVDDDRTIEELALHTHSSEHLVCRVLFDALQIGQLKLVRPRGRASEPQEAPVPVGSVDAEDLLSLGEEHLAAERFGPALRHLRAAQSLASEKSDIHERVRKAESHISEWLEGQGIALDAVPEIARTQDELPSLRISPKEVFILTRINGEYDIQTILKISPMPALDALLVFWRLHEEKHISFKPPSGGNS